MVISTKIWSFGQIPIPQNTHIKFQLFILDFEILRDFDDFSRSTKAKGISRALSRVMICLTDMCLDIFTKCGIFNYDCSNMVQGQFHEI